MSTAATGERRRDFFVAHAGPDVAIAVRLAALLEAGGASVFVDADDLLAGAVWPVVLAQAQESAAVTVILVSNHTGTAYYQLEELAVAIAMSRDAKSGHRVAPVYLERVESVPYGLRVVHGLWALDAAGLEAAAGQLLRLLPRPGDDRAAKLWSPLVPAKSRFFAPREALLSRLGAQGAQGTSVLTQTVTGLGGVGKTTVAAAWCWEQSGVVDIVWWLRAETVTTLVADLADLALELGCAGGAGGAGGEDLAVRADRACRALEREDRTWALVFDNADRDDLVHQFSPRRGNGRILVTTRRRNFERLGPVVDVDVLDVATTEAFLRSRVRETNPAAARDPAAEAVARRLGGLPLALEQAGAYVAHSPLRSFAAYLSLLDEAGLDPFIDGQPLDYQATATTTWQVSIDAAARRAPLAPRVMAVFGSLAPEPVPLACFVDLVAHPYLAASVVEVTSAIEELYAYSLLTIETDRLRVHRVVRDAARRSGGPAARHFAVDSLLGVHPRDVERPDRWAACAALLPHVLCVAAQAASDDPETAAKISWLLDRAGMALRHAGSVAQSIPLFEQAACLDVDLHGADHPATLQSRNNLALAYEEAGRITEAIAVLEQLLPDMVRLLGADHRDTLTSRNNLAAAFVAAGRIAEAVRLHEVNLAATEQLVGADHSDTLQSRNNLAASYQHAGRITEAITLLEANVAILERLLGAEDPITLTGRNNLATAYGAGGRTAMAMTQLEAIVGDFERVLGVGHPGTLLSRSNLALAYQAAGRTAEAMALFEATLAVRERILGPDHRDTLTSRNNLAESYRAAGRATEATALLEATFDDVNRLLGRDHPDTLTIGNNLALAYHEAGRNPEAIALLEAVLPDMKRQLGAHHPSTLQSRNNLATCFLEVRRTAEAISLLEANVSDVDQLLGADHPDLLQGRNNLAAAFLVAGRVAEAITLLEPNGRDAERLLGTSHPLTVKIRDNLALAYQVAERAHRP